MSDTKTNKLALVRKEDLSLVDNNSMNESQLSLILRSTPKQYVKQRPAKGGGTWDYVTGGYVKKMLNLMFGWDWDFEIVDQEVFLEAKEVVVKGRLTCRTNGKVIVKMQYGNKDIICKRDTGLPLSIGNDMKAAATDALKKCAAEIGIAADIYNKEDFSEVHISTDEDLLDQLKSLYTELENMISEDEKVHFERIIKNEEKDSYTKAIRKLQKLKQ